MINIVIIIRQFTTLLKQSAVRPTNLAISPIAAAGCAYIPYMAKLLKGNRNLCSLHDFSFICENFPMNCDLVDW